MVLVKAAIILMCVSAVLIPVSIYLMLKKPGSFENARKMVVMDANLKIKGHGAVDFPHNPKRVAQLNNPSIAWNHYRQEYALAFTHQDYSNSTPCK